MNVISKKVLPPETRFHGHTANRFEKHQVRSILVVILALVLSIEVLLRLVNPSILEFAYNFRQINRYHPKWKVDNQPGSSSFIRLRATGNVDLLSFLITINQEGFRTWDRPLDNNFVAISSGTRVVHAIGDSFTQGWGVNYESSYPAFLDFMLGKDVRVLNLGVNGFGAIGATGKSMELWDRYPADFAVYLFVENDYEGDEVATNHASLPGLVHWLYSGWNWLRQNTYIANCPYALVFRFRFSVDAGPKDLNDRKTTYQDSPYEVTVTSPRADVSDPGKGAFSKQAARAYKEFLDRRGVPFIVLALGPSETAQDFWRFCREQGIIAYYITVPDELLLRRDGHFNALGNYKVAKLVAKLMRQHTEWSDRN